MFSWFNRIQILFFKSRFCSIKSDSSRIQIRIKNFKTGSGAKLSGSATLFLRQNRIKEFKLRRYLIENSNSSPTFSNFFITSYQKNGNMFYRSKKIVGFLKILNNNSNVGKEVIFKEHKNLLLG